MHTPLKDSTLRFKHSLKDIPEIYLGSSPKPPKVTATNQPYEMLRSLILLIAFVSCQAIAADPPSQSTDSNVVKQPAPDWVKPISIDPSIKTPKEGTRGGIFYLCSDNQIHIEKAEEYGHYAYRFLNTSGLENKAQLSFSFDPEYQTMRLHRLILHRDGKKLDRLAETEVRVIEQESGHEQQLYDGSKTALVILKDVRVGDVLEYAYSIKGRNPVFGKHYCSFQKLGFSVTVAKIYKRFLWDSKIRTLRHKLFHCSKPVSINTTGALHEMTWEIEQSPAKKRDDDTPNWHLTSPLLQVTDYSSWSEFAEWAAPLYQIGTDLPETLKNECERIRKLPTDEERVMAALQYVQTNIRYLGSFMGTHSHEPYPVNVIYERRFGDCKDKSIILCTMLKHLGYEAVPALVDTDERKAIKEYLPSHFNFDHAIVHLKLKGNTYWLDGTRTFQCGRLENLFTPNYAYAFVITKDSKDLSQVKPRGHSASKTVILEHFTVPDLSGDMVLKVITTATGSDATSLRKYFSSTSIKEITEDYQKFYSSTYPEITAQPVTFSDDQKNNRFIVHEEYAITNFWKEDDSDSTLLQGWFEAQSIHDKIDSPNSPLRTMPYEIYHPVNMHHTVSIEMPQNWKFSPINLQIENDAFKFTSSSEITDRSLKLHYHYQSKQDFVPVSSIKQYMDECENAQNETYYQLFFEKSLANSSASTSQETSALSIILILSIACGAGLGTLLAVIAYFYDPTPKPTVEPEYLHGLSGWLILLGIRLCLTPLTLLGVFHDTEDFFQGPNLSNMLENGSGGAVVTMFAALSSTAFLLPLSIIVIILFFKKRSSFPQLYIAFLGLSFATEAFIYVLLLKSEGIERSVMDEAQIGCISYAIHVAIWIPYLLISKRVRNTFRLKRKNQLSPTPTPPGPPPLQTHPVASPPTAQNLGSPPTLSPPSGAPE